MNNLFLPNYVENVLVTGGAGFIGGALVRRLLSDTNITVYNLDKLGYASDLTSVRMLHEHASRHHLLQVDLVNGEATDAAIHQAKPDIVFHLAAESHVDRSIDAPSSFVDSNILGTFNLLQAVRRYWERSPADRQHRFRFQHISTDEVYGSLGDTGSFNENTPYDPRSPYSASKAASDHLVRAWHHTYGLPVVLTNCSNNYGPWQFPEKLIPLVILNAIEGKPIPLYGDGSNVRDWLFVEDHVDALILAATSGQCGESYCIGGHGERTNLQLVESICGLLDQYHPPTAPHLRLIKAVKDRPGHDHRYAIDPSRIIKELGWQPRHTLDDALGLTVKWYIANLDWCKQVCERSGFSGQRLGNINNSNKE